MMADCPPRQAMGCTAALLPAAAQRLAVNTKWVWDPRRDDPGASYDDGKSHPEEAAIHDINASHEAKASAWQERAIRLRDEGRLGGVGVAERHADYHDNARNDSPRERRERDLMEKQGKEY